MFKSYKWMDGWMGISASTSPLSSGADKTENAYMCVILCVCMLCGVSWMMVANIDDLTTPPPFPYHSLFHVVMRKI